MRFMTMLFFIALGLVVQPQGTEEIRVTHGRDMTALHERQDVIRGSCDGRPASLTITKVYRGQTPRLVLRAGRWRREIPPAFLNGAMFSSALKSAELACDGQRIQISGLAIRANSEGQLIMDLQEVILELRTGELSMNPLRTLTPAETLAELSPN